jgi:hypothetical protein
MFEVTKQLMFTFKGYHGQDMLIYSDNTYIGSGCKNSQWMLNGDKLFFRHEYHHEWRLIVPIGDEKDNTHFYKHFMENYCKYITELIEKELV